MSTRKPRPEEAPDEIARAALQMIAAGETSRTLAAYTVAVNLVVTEPRFVDKSKSKEGSR